MSSNNKTRYALLGMLCLSPMSGYDIKNRIAASVGYFWSESYGQIYPILRQFVEEGLATKNIQQQEGKPDRHVYQLTPLGETALVNWLSKPVEQYNRERNELLLKLYFGHQIPIENNIQHVKQYRLKLVDQLELYKEIEQTLEWDLRRDRRAEYWMITLRYGLKSIQALMEWCDETVLRLGEMEGE